MGTERLPGESCYREAVYGLEKYVAGYTTEQVQRELGLTDLVKLASNENAWGPSPKALAAIEGELHNLWQYPEQSFFDLKHVLAEHNGVRPENVVVGHGTEVIIQLIPQLFCNAGDDVVVADLTYGRYAEAAKLMDAHVQVVPLRDFHYDLKAVRAAVGPRTKLVWLCSPNNPTGCIVRRDEAAAFLDSLPEGVAVVFDQAYREFVDDPEYADGLRPAEGGARERHRAAHVLQGLRPRRHAPRLRAGARARVLAAGHHQGAVQPEPALHRRRARGPERPRVAGGLRDADHRRKNAAHRDAHGLGLRGRTEPGQLHPVDSGENAEELWDRLLRRGVIVRPCTGWGLTQHVRVTVGRPEQNERFLEALRAESQVLAGRGAGEGPAAAGAPAGGAR